MPQYLIVANQTLGGPALDAALRERIDRGDASFFIVVPMTALEHELAGSGFGFAVGDMMIFPPPEIIEDHAQRREQMINAARERAEERLATMSKRIAAAGGEVDGDVGSGDPCKAVKDVLDKRDFDEVIVSTLPAGFSRWLKMDLPSRIGRLTDKPVHTIELPKDEEPAG
jgi:nucleotide-binding universal stress UspA family protein